jgi:hypothetical protein
VEVVEDVGVLVPGVQLQLKARHHVADHNTDHVVQQPRG